ncbi:MAG: hypothetical protein IJV40_16695 [Oscillospiraceae bacterium]|nr:hypothetical protein [Oscillospiraceae bacterium]
MWKCRCGSGTSGLSVEAPASEIQGKKTYFQRKYMEKKCTGLHNAREERFFKAKYGEGMHRLPSCVGRKIFQKTIWGRECTDFRAVCNERYFSKEKYGEEMHRLRDTKTKNTVERTNVPGGKKN